MWHAKLRRINIFLSGKWNNPIQSISPSTIYFYWCILKVVLFCYAFHFILETYSSAVQWQNMSSVQNLHWNDFVSCIILFTCTQMYYFVIIAFTFCFFKTNLNMVFTIPNIIIFKQCVDGIPAVSSGILISLLLLTSNIYQFPNWLFTGITSETKHISLICQNLHCFAFGIVNLV